MHRCHRLQRAITRGPRTTTFRMCRRKSASHRSWSSEPTQTSSSSAKRIRTIGMGGGDVLHGRVGAQHLFRIRADDRQQAVSVHLSNEEVIEQVLKMSRRTSGSI